MTVNEAKQQIDVCERQIVESYSELKNNARTLGLNLARAASSKTSINTLWPLILCIIGLFVGGYISDFLGIVLIVAASGLPLSFMDLSK